MSTSLVSVAELKARLSDPDWCVLDCRHDLMDVELGRRQYAQGHVPGALFAGIDDDLSGPKTGANGRELQLYRVVPGEACILTSSCLLGQVAYRARGVADSDVVAVALPPAVFTALLAEHEPFRRYVFGLFAERMAELMALVEAVAFQRLDQRLAALLLGKGRIVRTTHQALADELGSVREIVSRLLKSFAERGLVSLSREQVEIVDARRLREIAAPA